ncbi:MAG: hypothetical protein Ct9H300mP15_21420 [Gemmatimonadota bacterium]|nr:MAG: hypothetical protein Ct9H300mP15_21420 [Gemmatimonadota bacterium]
MGGGWRGAGLGLEPDPNGSSPTAAFLAWFLGCIAIYGALFGTGYALYGRNALSLLCITTAALAILWLFRLLPKIELRWANHFAYRLSTFFTDPPITESNRTESP